MAKRNGGSSHSPRNASLSRPTAQPSLRFQASTAGSVQLSRPQQVHAISLQKVVCHLTGTAPKRLELTEAWSAMLSRLALM